jgi:nucleoside-diphosphate-sugar epimerase
VAGGVGERRVVALTGATGFLGRRLAPALAARGWKVRALARGPVSEGDWDEAMPQWVRGNLADSEALGRLVEGADLTIHAAGLIKAVSRAAFFAVNVDGAACVARAAQVSRASGRVILISSLAAREPQLSDYAASKRAGEDAMREILAQRLVTLRPPAIYGPGDQSTLGLFQLAASSPVLPVPAAPAARLALAYVDDVVAEICAAAEAGAGGGLYAIGGARPAGYGWGEIMSQAAQAVGREPFRLPLPMGVISAAGAVADVAARLSGRAMIFGSGKARELAHPDWSVSKAELAPWAVTVEATDLGAGFARTVSWYRAQGWL